MYVRAKPELPPIQSLAGFLACFALVETIVRVVVVARLVIEVSVVCMFEVLDDDK